MRSRCLLAVLAGALLPSAAIAEPKSLPSQSPVTSAVIGSTSTSFVPISPAADAATEAVLPATSDEKTSTELCEQHRQCSRGG